MTALTMVRAEDVEEAELIAVDGRFVADYGPQESWQAWQWEQYTAALDAVHRQFTPGERAS